MTRHDAVVKVAMLCLTPLLALGCLFVLARYVTCVFTNPDKAWNVAYEVDVASNVGANGKRDTTISARANRARLAHKPWGCLLCKLLDWISKDHCERQPL